MLRIRHLVASLIIFGALAPSDHVQSSWVDKTILIKNHGTKIGPLGGQIEIAMLDQASHRVLDERDGWIRNIATIQQCFGG